MVLSDGRVGIFGGIEDDDDLDGAGRGCASCEGRQDTEDIGFIVAGDDDADSEVVVGWVRDLRRAEAAFGEVASNL